MNCSLQYRGSVCSKKETVLVSRPVNKSRGEEGDVARPCARAVCLPANTRIECSTLGSSLDYQVFRVFGCCSK